MMHAPGALTRALLTALLSSCAYDTEDVGSSEDALLRRNEFLFQDDFRVVGQFDGPRLGSMTLPFDLGTVPGAPLIGQCQTVSANPSEARRDPVAGIVTVRDFLETVVWSGYDETGLQVQVWQDDESRRDIYIAIAGSSPELFSDLDVNQLSTNLDTVGLVAAHGYLAMVVQAVTEIFNRLPPNHRVFFAGHSQGGEIAEILGTALQPAEDASGAFVPAWTNAHPWSSLRNLAEARQLVLGGVIGVGIAPSPHFVTLDRNLGREGVLTQSLFINALNDSVPYLATRDAWHEGAEGIDPAAMRGRRRITGLLSVSNLVMGSNSPLGSAGRWSGDGSFWGQVGSTGAEILANVGQLDTPLFNLRRYAAMRAENSLSAGAGQHGLPFLNGPDTGEGSEAERLLAAMSHMYFDGNEPGTSPRRRLRSTLEVHGQSYIDPDVATNGVHRTYPHALPDYVAVSEFDSEARVRPLWNDWVESGVPLRVADAVALDRSTYAFVDRLGSETQEQDTGDSSCALRVRQANGSWRSYPILPWADETLRYYTGRSYEEIFRLCTGSVQVEGEEVVFAPSDIFRRAAAFDSSRLNAFLPQDRPYREAFPSVQVDSAGNPLSLEIEVRRPGLVEIGYRVEASPVFGTWGNIRMHFVQEREGSTASNPDLNSPYNGGPFVAPPMGRIRPWADTPSLASGTHRNVDQHAVMRRVSAVGSQRYEVHRLLTNVPYFVSPQIAPARLYLPNRTRGQASAGRRTPMSFRYVGGLGYDCRSPWVAAGSELVVESPVGIPLAVGIPGWRPWFSLSAWNFTHEFSMAPLQDGTINPDALCLEPPTYLEDGTRECPTRVESGVVEVDLCQRAEGRIPTFRGGAIEGPAPVWGFNFRSPDGHWMTRARKRSPLANDPSVPDGIPDLVWVDEDGEVGRASWSAPLPRNEWEYHQGWSGRPLTNRTVVLCEPPDETDVPLCPPTHSLVGSEGFELCIPNVALDGTYRTARAADVTPTTPEQPMWFRLDESPSAVGNNPSREEHLEQGAWCSESGWVEGWLEADEVLSAAFRAFSSGAPPSFVVAIRLDPCKACNVDEANCGDAPVPGAFDPDSRLVWGGQLVACSWALGPDHLGRPLFTLTSGDVAECGEIPGFRTSAPWLLERGGLSVDGFSLLSELTERALPYRLARSRGADPRLAEATLSAYHALAYPETFDFPARAGFTAQHFRADRFPVYLRSTSSDRSSEGFSSSVRHPDLNESDCALEDRDCWTDLISRTVNPSNEGSSRSSDGNCSTCALRLWYARIAGLSFYEVAHGLSSGVVPLIDLDLMVSPTYFGREWWEVKALVREQGSAVVGFGRWTGPVPAGFDTPRRNSGHYLHVESTEDGALVGYDAQRGLVYSEAELHRWGVTPTRSRRDERFAVLVPTDSRHDRAAIIEATFVAYARHIEETRQPAVLEMTWDFSADASLRSSGRDHDLVRVHWPLVGARLIDPSRGVEVTTSEIARRGSDLRLREMPFADPPALAEGFRTAASTDDAPTCCRPTGEVCNGVDDDCDDLVDEGCTEGCVTCGGGGGDDGGGGGGGGGGGSDSGGGDPSCFESSFRGGQCPDVDYVIQGQLRRNSSAFGDQTFGFYYDPTNPGARSPWPNRNPPVEGLDYTWTPIRVRGPVTSIRFVDNGIGGGGVVFFSGANQLTSHGDISGSLLEPMAFTVVSIEREDGRADDCGNPVLSCVP